MLLALIEMLADSLHLVERVRRLPTEVTRGYTALVPLGALNTRPYRQSSMGGGAPPRSHGLAGALGATP